MKKSHFLAAAAFGAVFGFGLASSNIVAAYARQAQPTNPQEPALQANLYMQTSAEYRAVCLQTYSMAAKRLQEKLSARQGDGKRPAVVMDLDETVIDNSGFQSFLDKYKLSYSSAAWEKWERDYGDEVALVPGAKAFIDWAESQGVLVVYISNRNDSTRNGTIQALKHVGLSTANLNQRLLLRTTTSDKTPRREEASKNLSVLMYFGDNLRDFDETFVVPKLAPTDVAGQDKAIQERLAKVDALAYRFGSDWIVLPNPAYGEWMNPLGPDPRSKLRPTKMTPAGK